MRTLIKQYKNIFIAGEHTCDFCTLVGLTDEIVSIKNKIDEIRGSIVVKINVSAPFPCKFMNDAIKLLKKEFSYIKWNDPKLGFISDFDGDICYSAKKIVNNFYINS